MIEGFTFGVFLWEAPEGILDTFESARATFLAIFFEPVFDFLGFGLPLAMRQSFSSIIPGKGSVVPAIFMMNKYDYIFNSCIVDSIQNPGCFTSD